MQRTSFLPFLILVASTIVGCGSVQEVERVEQPPPEPVVEMPPPPPPLSFHTSTDTVHPAATSLNPSASRRNPEIRFMVQIGAFTSPENASGVQSKARSRVPYPVINDFNMELGLYQIRVGFFETREAAYSFREKLIREFPVEYKDAWVVQLTR